MDVLSPDFKLRRDLDRLTDPDLDLRRVGALQAAGDTLFISMAGPGGPPLVYVRRRGQRFQAVKGFDSVDDLWPADDRRVLVLADGALWLAASTGEPAKVLDLPDGARSVDACWHEDGVRAAALVDENEAADPNAPLLHPQDRKRYVVRRYTPVEGWHDLGDAASMSGQLSGDREMKRLVWREPLKPFPEEAQRAEVRGYDVDKGEAIAFTEGAGQMRGLLMARDGSGFVYRANHSGRRPITTHCDLWWRPWEVKARARNLTQGGRHVEGFGWEEDLSLIHI